ncbi:pre-B-cell leukemia transcription factor-interacting protein 1 [Lampris incognitus]|uniref:pre-B-cell leukemia transcription factor-interacting protein 1 n=1 Tax=Lampris incognitus TaxID=2546036 RepID=UPI0024B55A3D|nr:pre-B-cell leukemia transcription factor-interacting protein 1 [Lampris incognitus]XP_056154091.1 pre-B-cell leukemia transcription factor-interacting protein 1 [Lampris incognitus]XP_056154092.1 pre-B-cell leukemia transcription factor-interacting protein 1 [Lampris incognitus]XP_056154093.1 pre-B-cell leukemia transcription factor-interacting protein 1 [Lampris incognitus]
MSDNSNSTGSSGSSTNSWTLLSPEEAAVETVGPVDDGTESLGDVPSLSEEVAGATMEFKPSEILAEPSLSEEGHQVCQETSPEASKGPIPSSPTRSSPLPPQTFIPPDPDLESQPPVIHDIVTSSPSDNEQLGAIPFVTNLDLEAPLDIPVTELLPAEPESRPVLPIPEIDIPAELVPDTPADIGPVPESPVECPTPADEPDAVIPTETLSASDLSSHVDTIISPSPEITETPSSVPESHVSESTIHDSPLIETVGPYEAEEEPSMEKEQAELSEEVSHYEKEEAPTDPSSSFDFARDETSSDDDGLRRRSVPSFETQRPRTSDEEDDDEELEFKLAEKKEEKRGFSLNKCIVGALVLLCLGSLFFSDDFDSSELNDGDQTKDMNELLDKLAQENQQISQLEAQLQTQKEELDSALKAATEKGDEKGKEDLEKENAKMKEELSFLPGLREELETLRARVTELTQITANQDTAATTPSSAPTPGGQTGESKQSAPGPERRKDGERMKEELHRQKVLLDESKKRLEGMKRSGGNRKGVTDSLKEIQRRLSEQVEKLGKKKPWEGKWSGNKGKDNGRDHWKKEDKKEWKGEKDRKHGKDRGQWEKEERKGKDWMLHKQNSHKEAWRKYQEEWERKKDERRMDREERRKEKPWHSQPAKTSHSHKHQHHHHQQHQSQQPHQYNHNDFWSHQEEKLRHNVRPLVGCGTMEDCAAKEGLYPVELSEFEELLEGYLSKLDGSPSESKDQIRKLTAKFFEDGVFIHNKFLFSDFAEDVADILEDMADVLEDDGPDNNDDDNDALEEEMEEFEREALWKFSATA